MHYIILFILIIVIIAIICIIINIITTRNKGKKIADSNYSNYGNIIDRMVSLYLLCEGDRHTFKKLKMKYFNEDIYRDEIFLFDFDYRFNITFTDRIILTILLFFYTPAFWQFDFNCKKHMYQFIDFVINNYINRDNIIHDDISNTMCIHIRCSDIPFNRATSYNLVSLYFYKKAIQYAISVKKMNKIVFLLCSTHRGSKNDKKYITVEKSVKNQDMCNHYMNFYMTGLKEYNIPIEIKCNTIGTDFYYLKNAGCSIVTSGSFGLYGAYASNNLLILSDNVKNNNYRNNIIVIHDNIIHHANVKNYYDIYEMKKHIGV
jgi:hypothetical protein